MHLPLTRREIANFLEFSEQKVEELWETGQLQRSVHCVYRYHEDLTSTTVYDLLEYALSCGILPVCISRELSALWVAELAEADESEFFNSACLSSRIEELLHLAHRGGLAEMTSEPEKTAVVSDSTQAAILNCCK